jgi:hypothetical protein
VHGFNLALRLIAHRLTAAFVIPEASEGAAASGLAARLRAT